MSLFKKIYFQNCKVDKNVSSRDEAELKTLAKTNLPLVKSKKKKKKKGKDKCSQKKERKATQTLAIVLGKWSGYQTHWALNQCATVYMLFAPCLALQSKLKYKTNSHQPP